MWFSGQGGGRDGVTNMDVVTSALAEVGRVVVAVGGLREMVGWAVNVWVPTELEIVVVEEGCRLAEGVADVVRRRVAVTGLVPEAHVDQVSVLWVAVEVAGEGEGVDVMVGGGDAVEDNGEYDVDTVAVADGVCSMDAELVRGTVPVSVQPPARCEMFAAQGYRPCERTHSKPLTWLWQTWNVGASAAKTDGTDTMPPVPVVVTLTTLTCPVPVMDVASTHLDHTPSIEASSTLTVPLTNIGPYSTELNTPPAVTTSRTSVSRPTRDSALPREIFMMEDVYSTYNCQSPTTLTLYVPMVVP